MIGWLSVASSSIVCGPLGLPVGTINVDTLGNDFAMLTGNCLALFTSPIICVIITLIKPQNYDWEELHRVTSANLIGEDRHASKEQVCTCVLVLCMILTYPHVQLCCKCASFLCFAALGKDTERTVREPDVCLQS
jgi:hypothetical protein